MSQWEQHYYTWSTNSLSGNKVGLGIVAATDKNDRKYLRIMENQGARSEVCREEDNLTIERLSYSEELPGYIRSGATPCASGADKRNNKFVHLYSLKETGQMFPEDYLLPLRFKKQWNGEQELSVLQTEEVKTEKGRRDMKKILSAYGLEGRLEELFVCVYRCLLAGEKPLSLVHSGKRPEEFAEFSRQMMILIHYMIPKSLRKEADYVSYVKEDSQEAHFLFRQSGGGFCFDFQGQGRKSREFALMEEEFYQKLAKAFVEEDDGFDQLMNKLDRFLQGLSDKRNQLEKCIFICMASEAGKSKNKEAFFTGVERLMYWARKDKSLISALQDATGDLDFHSMEEEELLSYVNLLLTGAGGETKEMAYRELNRMLRYYYRSQDVRFDQILDRICKKNHSVYEQILKENEAENGFTKMVLYQPIENRIQLKDALKNHESFLEEEDYRYYIANAAYLLYQKAKSEEARKEIASLGKKADKDVFIKLKQKDVEAVLKKAETIEEFVRMADQMEIADFEEPIRKSIYEMAVSLLKPEFEKMTPKDLIKISFRNREESAGTAIYLQVIENLAMDVYLQLLKEKREEFYTLNAREWIRFVLKLTGSLENQQKEQAKEAISRTKEAVLAKKDLLFLAEVNQTLKNHGAMPISCTEELWNEYQIRDFAYFYEKVSDISLLKCEDSPVYLALEILYHFAEQKIGKDDTKKLGLVLKKDGQAGEELLQALAALWGKNETLDLDFFYPVLEATCGKEEGRKIIEKAVQGNEKGMAVWKEYEKMCKKEVEKKMRQQEKRNPIANIIDDILSKSIEAVLLGFYGFVYISLREKLMYAEAYRLSVVGLVILLVLNIYVTFSGKTKKQTPGAIIYLAGMGIFLMNMGLSLDTPKAVQIFYGCSAVIAVIMKLIHIFLHQSDQWKKK